MEIESGPGSYRPGAGWLRRDGAGRFGTAKRCPRGRGGSQQASGGSFSSSVRQARGQRLGGGIGRQ
ncbi:MAG TPA: hypothetical protein VIR57_11650 [Chloroflexota bacterium]